MKAESSLDTPRIKLKQANLAPSDGDALVLRENLERAGPSLGLARMIGGS